MPRGLATRAVKLGVAQGHWRSQLFRRPADLESEPQAFYEWQSVKSFYHCWSADPFTFHVSKWIFAQQGVGVSGAREIGRVGSTPRVHMCAAAIATNWSHASRSVRLCTHCLLAQQIPDLRPRRFSRNFAALSVTIFRHVVWTVCNRLHAPANSKYNADQLDRNCSDCRLVLANAKSRHRKRYPLTWRPHKVRFRWTTLPSVDGKVDQSKIVDYPGLKLCTQIRPYQICLRLVHGCINRKTTHSDLVFLDDSHYRESQSEVSKQFSSPRNVRDPGEHSEWIKEALYSMSSPT